jgi:hypothetical protein
MYSIGNLASPDPGSMGASPDSASGAAVQVSRDDMAVAFQSVTRPVRATAARIHDKASYFFSGTGAALQGPDNAMSQTMHRVRRQASDGVSPQFDAVTVDKKTAASAAVDFECIEPVDTANEPATIVQRTR